MSEQKEYESSFFYFENSTMRGLYDCLENWQTTAQKNILSISIQKDHEDFCCIVLADSRKLSHTSLTPYEADMNRFRRKALKHIGVRVDFVSNNIGNEKILEIQNKLENCRSANDVHSVFLEAYSTN